jgi:hypothetical protein
MPVAQRPREIGDVPAPGAGVDIGRRGEQEIVAERVSLDETQ